MCVRVRASVRVFTQAGYYGNYLILVIVASNYSGDLVQFHSVKLNIIRIIVLTALRSLPLIAFICFTRRIIINFPSHTLEQLINMIVFLYTSQLAFFINLQRPAVDLYRMLTGLVLKVTVLRYSPNRILLKSVSDRYVPDRRPNGLI